MVNAPARTWITLKYSRKYGVSWARAAKQLLSARGKGLVAFAALTAVLLVLELGDVVILGSRLQCLGELAFYEGLGTGCVGYSLALLYYVAEGLWLSTVLEVGSRRFAWGVCSCCS